jgi:hypothetical protein
MRAWAFRVTISRAVFLLCPQFGGSLQKRSRMAGSRIRPFSATQLRIRNGSSVPL